MEPILFLVHRIPYPPDKGDKIRSYHILKYLCSHYKVYLGCFIDDQNDVQYCQKLNEMCEDVFFVHKKKINVIIDYMKGLLNGDALSVSYFSSRQMQNWVDKVISSHSLNKAYAFSSPMAQYLMKHNKIKRVMDFIDVDSDKWKQYSHYKKGLKKWIYIRESHYLKKFEITIADKFDVSVFVSDKEVELFNKIYPKRSCKYISITNGVNFNYYNYHHLCESPFEPDTINLVFTGTMSYWSNIDAVHWFANSIFSKLYKKDKRYRFYIVGNKPDASVKLLAKLKGVIVTGKVKDIRPFVLHSNLVVAPMRIARGLQNKVLETMALNKMVFLTQAALDGIYVHKDTRFVLANNDLEFINKINSFVGNKNSISNNNEAILWMRDYYNWKQVLKPLEKIFD